MKSMRRIFRIASGVLVLLAAGLNSPDGAAQTFTFGKDAPLTWQKVKGTAQDVGVSPTGSVFVVSRQGRMWRWGSVLGEEWKTMSGHGFARVDSGSSNKPWAVTEDGRVRYYNGLWWETRGEGFIDIGAGRKGVVYALGKNGDVAKWTPKERRFIPENVKQGIRIDVDRDGHPWVVDDAGTVHRFDGNEWRALPGVVVDISIGPSGLAFAALSDGAVVRWRAADTAWVPIEGIARVHAVSVGPGGKPWAVTNKGRVHATSLFLAERQREEEREADARPAPASKHRAAPIDPAGVTDPSPIKFKRVTGQARDIAIGADGSVFIVQAESTALGRYSNRRKVFIDFPGELSRLAVAADGSPWGVNNRREVYRHDGKDWIRVLGAEGLDIAIGGSGDVFVTSPDETLYRLDAATGRFKRYLGATGIRVAVDGNATPWVINGMGEIRRCDESPCKRLARKGRDIAIGPDGSVFLADTDGKVLTFDQETGNWRPLLGVTFQASAVAVGPKGRPWAVDIAGGVHASSVFDRDEGGDVRIAKRTVKRTTTSTKSIFTFTKSMTFEAADVSGLGGIDILDIAVGADGTVIGVQSTLDGEYPQDVLIFNHKSDKFETADDQPTVYASSVAVDPDGEMWFVSTTPSTTTAYVYEQRGHSFKKRTGLRAGGSVTPDIAVGADGTVFAIDTYGKVYRYDPAAYRFRKFISSGAYAKIAVDPLGIPWVTDSTGLVYQWDGSKFVRRLYGTPSTATDIGIGADGSLFLTLSTTGALKRWNASNQDFDDLSNGTGGRLAVSPEGRPWFIKFGDLTKVFKPKK